MSNSTAVKSNSERKFGLDLIRAIAICLVLVSHFSKQSEALGFWGVELFFALSGYLIGQILWRNFNASENWSLKNVVNFWSRRWWRTLPNYYLFLLIMLLYHYYIRPPFPSLKEFTDFLWFGQNLLSRNHGFYSVSWSLCIEEWFYLVFPVLLWLCTKAGFKDKQSFNLTFAFLILFSIAVRFYLQYTGTSSIRTISLARLDAICYGVAAAYLSAVFTLSYRLKVLLFTLGLSMLLLSGLVFYGMGYTVHFLSNSQLMLIVVPLAAAVLLPFSSLMERPESRVYSWFIVMVEKLSLWSYSIYLSHIPIMFTIYLLLDNIRDHIIGNLFSKILGLTITILFSGLIFKFFELPFTRMRPKELKP
ncbi:acyltransferase family protein [Pedobacter psychroterrae]|uniref:Acyltransferase n=1 Tax=Pedobacter psychroterrae TaxID=2530453 RepID=A0A4R0NTA3_9SPHI|nr:acyltransferase [Pedobacter psychroterrae]TCD02675.1 acyltransferase [Pedobacter psychroterrae]